MQSFGEAATMHKHAGFKLGKQIVDGLRFASHKSEAVYPIVFPAHPAVNRLLAIPIDLRADRHRMMTSAFVSVDCFSAARHRVRRVFLQAPAFCRVTPAGYLGR